MSLGPWPVSPSKIEDLNRRLLALGIREEDLEESFMRSSGAGGQNVNKVSTCVTLVHRPSGLQVRCQRERSQALNRFIARRMLVERLEEVRAGRLAKHRAEAEKIRRQKRRRSRRSKNKMLDEKRAHGQKKAWRRGPARDEA